MGQLIGRGWRTAREHALDLLYESECLSCGIPLLGLHAGLPLCDDCLAEIPPIDWPTCRRCAAEVPEHPGSVDTCSRCEVDKLRFDRTFSLGHYDGLLRELILRMKADHHEQWGQVFVRLLGDRYGGELSECSFDGIIPIPMTAWHRWMRGTNAPGVIAHALGRALNIPVFSRLVTRTYDAGPQRGLSRAGRFRNVRGGYRMRKGYRLDAPHILLVDDVMTTGATCSEVARLLKRSGADRVTVLVVARTPNN
jgi:ComF family protein